MKALLYYLVQVLVTSGILYTYYHFALRNKKFHRYNRFYLLAATVISIMIPFLNIPVYFTQTETQSSFVLQTLTVISSTGSVEPVLVVTNHTHSASWFSWQNLSYSFYILIASVAFLRIIISLIKIRRIAKNNPVEQLDNIRFINTNEPGTPFSFFRWLFWNRKIELRSEKGEQIFRHELFHIKQKHSWDIMYMELLAVVFWINPFFHLMKKEIKAIHEFLADQFAVTENTRWQYAELLLMQVLNTNQQLVNPFFHNQIKRRIAMISTSKKPNYQYFRKLMVLPVAAIAIILFAFKYKSIDDNRKITIGETNNVTDTAKPERVALTEIAQPVVTKPKTEIWLNGDFYIHTDTMLFDGSLALNAKIISKDSSNPLIVLNGKALEGVALKDINDIIKPEVIQSINILKGKSAAAKYGSKAKDGVIEIITKKNTGDVNKQEVIPADTIKPPIGDNKIFDKVEIEPSFPGGELKWRQYMERNLDASIPAKKKAPDGAYTVLIQFIVDKEGNISDVRALTNHGYGMENEALRVIKSGPRWTPAVQNGRQVSSYKKQPITFIVGKGQKNFPSPAKTNGTELNEIAVANLSPQNTDDKVFDKVETPPSFPGGESAWKRYLETNANSLVPVDSGAAPGVYKVMVQFIVHEDGSLSDVKALTHHGFGMENEAMRVIKKGPKWIPAKQNGHIVTAYIQQPITFAITDEDGTSTQNPSQPTTTISPGIPKITEAELKKASVIKLLQLPEGTQIVSYSFIIYMADGGIIKIPNAGKEFNEATIDQIDITVAGKTITFDKIKMITFDQIKIIENGKEKPIPSKTYAVTS